MEILDIVDDKDNVIAQASKDDAYKKHLPHRIVHIFIFNDEGKMALQLRSAKVSFCPLHWSPAVGGHVQTGETYEQAALREYEEELGVKSELKFLAKDFYQTSGVPDKFISTFITHYNGPFPFDPEVVKEVEFFTMDEIKRIMESEENFHPELLFLLKKYFIKS